MCICRAAACEHAPVCDRHLRPALRRRACMGRPARAYLAACRRARRRTPTRLPPPGPPPGCSRARWRPPCICARAPPVPLRVAAAASLLVCTLDCPYDSALYSIAYQPRETRHSDRSHFEDVNIQGALLTARTHVRRLCGRAGAGPLACAPALWPRRQRHAAATPHLHPSTLLQSLSLRPVPLLSAPCWLGAARSHCGGERLSMCVNLQALLFLLLPSTVRPQL